MLAHAKMELKHTPLSWVLCADDSGSDLRIFPTSHLKGSRIEGNDGWARKQLLIHADRIDSAIAKATGS